MAATQNCATFCPSLALPMWWLFALAAVAVLVVLGYFLLKAPTTDLPGPPAVCTAASGVHTWLPKCNAPDCTMRPRPCRTSLMHLIMIDHIVCIWSALCGRVCREICLGRASDAGYVASSPTQCSQKFFIGNGAEFVRAVQEQRHNWFAREEHAKYGPVVAYTVNGGGLFVSVADADISKQVHEKVSQSAAEPRLICLFRKCTGTRSCLRMRLRCLPTGSSPSRATHGSATARASHCQHVIAPA